MNITQAPAWDLTQLYKSPEDPQIERDLKQVAEWCQNTLTKTKNQMNLKLWAQVTLESEEVTALMSHIGCYIGNLSALNPNFPTAQVLEEKFSKVRLERAKVGSAFNSFLKNLNDEETQSFLNLSELKDLQFFLEKNLVSAKVKASTLEENLMSEMDLTGAASWYNLYYRHSSQMRFKAKVNDVEKEFSMSQRRSLTEDPSPDIRKEVFHKSNEEFKKNVRVFEFCINGIVGTRLTKMKHRGRTDYLETGLQQSLMSRPALDALLKACEELKPLCQSYLQWKGSKLGRPFGYYDLEAPVGKTPSSTRIEWRAAWEMIEESFKVYPRLLSYAQELLREGRIEARSLPEKSPGGFCSGSRKIRKSYVYLNYGGSMGDVLTLAHEIGHAFHSEVLKSERVLHCGYPMTLAETASTFAEALMNQTLLSSNLLSAEEKNALKVTELNRHCAFLIDIPTRFQFESKFHEERLKGFVPAEKITELMISAQKNWWGNWIDEKELDPCFWMSKMHFYSNGTEFYNFPYTVGFLLSRLLAEKFIADPKGFATTYEAFLKETGRVSVDDIIKSVLGEDATSVEFWKSGAKSFAPTFCSLHAKNAKG